MGVGDVGVNNWSFHRNATALELCHDRNNKQDKLGSNIFSGSPSLNEHNMKFVMETFGAFTLLLT